MFRIVAIVAAITIVVFCSKDWIWTVLFAPSNGNFITYRLIENVMHSMGVEGFRFKDCSVDLITTELSSQFMQHIKTSIYLGLLGGSPYILFELFRFVSPALYENERRYSVQISIVIYVLFLIGVLMTYYVLFPISFRFLGTYSVSERIQGAVTLDSYISTFITLTLLVGLVFQLPVISFILAKMGIISSKVLSKYRKHSLLIISFVAAVITPPDLLTLVLVILPLYFLYEVSIWITRCVRA